MSVRVSACCSSSRNMAPRRKFDLKFKEKVLQYAEENSGEKTARHFNIDSKRIRYWRKQKEELLHGDKERARLSGGGRKKVSLELERRLVDWIYSMRDKHNRVSRNMIKKKALEIYPSVSDGGKTFVASTGWLQRFLQRNDPSLRRPAFVAQKDLLTEKLVCFIDHVGRTVTLKGIVESDIIAMDETVVCFDVVTSSSDTQRANSDALKTTRQKESSFTVVLAAKADGTRLKPFIVFRGGEVEAKKRQNAAVVDTSADGRMNDALTADWLRSVVGKVSATPRLLVWDSFGCHVGAAATEELNDGYNITSAVIPRGCAKHVQAADLMWKRPFKQSLQDACDLWSAADSDQKHTSAGRPRVPRRRLLVDWVVAAWNKLDEDLIRESFKVCGLSVKSDGSEDDLILCFREGQPSGGGREALSRARQRSQENRPGAAGGEEDEEELFNHELVVLDDVEEDDDDGEDDEPDDEVILQHCTVAA